jgi:hypothetical protein
LGGTCTPIAGVTATHPKPDTQDSATPSVLRLPRVLADTAPGNVASQKVGMRPLGQTDAYSNATHEVYQARRAEWCRGHLPLDSDLHT